MESNFKDNILTIFLEGNVDTTNAEQIGSQIDEIRSQNPEGKLIIDCDKLNYISSAGLRQILRLKKKEKDNFALINCKSEVYEVFEMTGFTEMMDISKGYRHVNVEGCEKIGEGSNGIVYRLDPETIIKVYKYDDALDDMKRERELAKRALVLGINTAIPFDVVKVGDKYGSVFELLTAKSITKHINADPDNVDKYVQIFVDMLKGIHETEVDEGILPDANVRGIGWCEDVKDKLPDDVYEKLHGMLEAIPHTNHMIHGDYHTNNVHYAEGQDPLLIDMDTLAIGNPVYEFANIFLAYRGFGELDQSCVSDFLGIAWDTCQHILEKTFELYFADKNAEELEIIKKKAEAIGFVRLYRRTYKRDKDNTALIDHCKERLCSLVNELDDLAL